MNFEECMQSCTCVHVHVLLVFVFPVQDVNVLHLHVVGLVLFPIALFYYTLGNLSPKYRSSLQSIQLLIAVKSSLLVGYGADKVLKPVLDEIRQLECVSCLCYVYNVAVMLFVICAYT